MSVYKNILQSYCLYWQHLNSVYMNIQFYLECLELRASNLYKTVEDFC
jgi:hypothetical protein